jgi:hypothetical protein
MKHTGFLIDATARRIEEVDIGDFLDMQKKIGCECFCIGDSLRNNDVLYVDDNGFINGTEDGFFWNGRMMAGNGLICGNDSSGESQDALSHLQDIEAQVKFFPFGETITDVVTAEVVRATDEMFS